MSKPLLTDAASRLRIVTDLTTSLIVEAGAGSGKTHQMAARMAAGIAEGVYQVEHMAAVTFTRKAAAELRGRFQASLEVELDKLTSSVSSASSPVPSVKEARVREALSNIERTFSGTIHAFCARLLRERPIEAGVAPGFAELDDVEERLMRESSWREFRAQARAAGDSDLALLNDAGIKAKDLDKAFAAVCNYEDVDFPAEDVPAPDVDAAWAALDTFWQMLRPMVPVDRGTKVKCDTLEKAWRFERQLDFFRRQGRTPRALADLLKTWDFSPDITPKWWSDDAATKKRLKADYMAAHEQFRTGVVSPWLEAWKRHLYAPCIRLLIKARDFAQHDRRLRNTLSFNDLLIRTAKVLRENESVRRALQDKYRWIFVDEFQDTDPLQAEIMFLLSDGIPDGGPGLQPGTTRALYVVGDPKQSIYRFRRADIDIYNHVRSVIGGPDDANVVSLTTNFRSVPQLCDWANQVFTTRFPAKSEAYAPAFAPLEPAPESAVRRAACSSRPPNSLFTLTSDSAADEAAHIAKYIRSEVDAGRRGFGDFLILTRKRKPLKVYVEALESLQIPIEVAGAGAFGESAEVRELSQLLQALADPQDSVALVGVLRGPLFGISDRALYAWKQSGEYFGLFSELDEVRSSASIERSSACSSRPREAVRRAAWVSRPPSAVANALSRLREWHHHTRTLPAGAALDRILEDSGYLALAATTTGGVEAGDLLHAVDRVRAAVESGFTLAEAAEALQDAAQESSEVESWPLEPGRQDVVRVMNLHKAKGLEAEVVFLADPDASRNYKPEIRILREQESVRSPGALAPGTGFLPIARKSEKGIRNILALPPDWPTHAAEEQKYLDAEEDRLLYVAATRAKDILVVGRATKPGKSGAWSGLDDFLTGVPELPVSDQVVLSEPAAIDFASATAAIARADATHSAANQPTWFATSVTEEVRRADLPWPEPSRGQPRQLDPTSVLTAETPARRADAGVAWGTLVHGLLEHAMRFPQATSADLRRLALWLTVEEPDLRPLIDQAVATVEGVAQADFWTATKISTEVHEEAPFAVRDEVGDQPGVLNGVIDLVYSAGDEWQIVDYKTDVGAATADLAQRYSGQMSSYERAWAALAGGSTRGRFVSVRHSV